LIFKCARSKREQHGSNSGSAFKGGLEAIDMGQYLARTAASVVSVANTAPPPGRWQRLDDPIELGLPNSLICLGFFRLALSTSYNVHPATYTFYLYLSVLSCFLWIVCFKKWMCSMMR